MPDICALTLRNPWGWAIAHAGKNVENRGWETSFRGLLAIHAGLSTDAVLLPTPAAIRAHLTATRDQDPALKVRGAVVAVARLHDIHHADDCGLYCSPWAAPGSFHWELADVKTLREPVPCRGRQRLWRLSPDVETAVRNQIGAKP